ncbi:MAG: TIGR00730 family Rossman fold protein [Burkholderiales bacterium]|nr:TIGR00730 family Rossman fold protein [Burkholderiales bacterium]
MKTACVFCGSNAGSRPVYAEAARAMGEALVARGVTLVYGGGRVGLMGEIARATLAAGGRVVGVIPRALLRKELVYDDLTELHVVESMHERKALMAERADAFVAMPGGYGTFEEFCEVLTWSQLGFHHKAVALLNVAGYFDGLLALFDHAVAEGFVRPAHRGLVLADDDPGRLLDRLARYRPPAVEKWITSPDAV